MGKIFPRLTTLKENPSSYEATVRLIERSFHYKSPNSFLADFAPLMEESNHHNCFVLLNESDEVIAHIGVKERSININNKFFSICMLGGIAVDEKFRGQGHFQQLFQHALSEKRSDTCFFILWSDQDKLYDKHGFHLCGGQYETQNHSPGTSFKKTKYSALSEENKRQIQRLYKKSFADIYLSLERSEADWDSIAKITSADLYLEEKQGNVESYFFINKGQDLEGIIYEYATSGEFKSFLKRVSGFGKIWTGAPFIESNVEQYQFMLAPGDFRLFSEFVAEYTKELMLIKNINVMRQEVFFEFNQETLVLSTEEFLRGIFGPAPFEELGEIKPLFISGLDSI